MTAASPETSLQGLRNSARRIFAHALQAASIPAAFDRHLRFDGNTLVNPAHAGGKSLRFPLDRYKKVHAIALGKAALPMLETLLERIPGPLSLSGVCCAPSLPQSRHPAFDYYAGGHPSPNEDSFRSVRAALQLLHLADRDTFVFFLVSGGGSAMFELPLDEGISLQETIAFHRALVGSGASIAEINTVRKHFSAVKGGRLAAAAPDADKFSLLVSDVPDRHLDALSSGPTLPDRSSVEECRDVLTRYRLLDKFPAKVREFFMRPDLPETPGGKHERGPQFVLAPAPAETEGLSSRAEALTSGFAHSWADVLLSNHDLLIAAREEAERHGWKVVVDNSCDDWDYREAAQYLLKRLRQLRREHPRICLLSGGEVTVRLEDEPGTGGRNQQFALACALELADSAPSIESSRPSIAVLSAGSDGVDGNSPAAGAVVDSTTAARARALDLDPKEALQRFDAFPLFTALGDTVTTGPTKNNLRDLRILLNL